MFHDEIASILTYSRNDTKMKMEVLFGYYDLAI